MNAETRVTDAKARLVLPKSFANSTDIVEQASETELRVRKANGNAEVELPFVEESSVILSDRDRFLKLLSNPPTANQAWREAAKRHQARK